MSTETPPPAAALTAREKLALEEIGVAVEALHAAQRGIKRAARLAIKHGHDGEAVRIEFLKQGLGMSDVLMAMEEE